MIDRRGKTLLHLNLGEIFAASFYKHLFKELQQDLVLGADVAYS